jgi:chromate transport protein ChrA
MKYLVKDGSKSHIAVIVLKWLFSVIMVLCTVWNISKAPLGALIYLLAGVLMCPLLVKNQKHKIWVIIVAILLYIIAPRVVSLITTGKLLP